MAKNVFSVPIFFIVFRETIEGAIILATLLGLVHQIAYNTRRPGSTLAPSDDANNRVARRLKIRILVGSAIGFTIALAIGAAFIGVWFTKGDDLFSKVGVLWTAILELIASIMIFVTGLLMLGLERAKVKWCFVTEKASEGGNVNCLTATGKWVLFFLPFIVILREGLEVVVYVGGVALGQPATSIPLAAIVGLVVGLVIGVIVYQFARRITPRLFMAVMTNLLLLVGAGLFSRSVGSLEWFRWLKLLNFPLSDGDGSGTYPVQGNVWHLDCCNPNDLINSRGWAIFNAILGWTNNATDGTVLSYVFYWLAVIIALAYMRFRERRTPLLRKGSAVGAQ